jgi:hypothetical protein
MVLDTEVPVVATIQANRDAAKHNNANLDEIAFSDAIGQDVTVAIRVINDRDGPTISLVLGGSREFKLHGFKIHGEPATNFSFHSEMSEKDIRKAQEGDMSEEEEKKGRKKSSAKDPKQAERRKEEQKILNRKLRGLRK